MFHVPKWLSKVSSESSSCRCFSRRWKAPTWSNMQVTAVFSALRVRGDLETNCWDPFGNISFNEGFFSNICYQVTSKPGLSSRFLAHVDWFHHRRPGEFFWGNLKKKLFFWCSFHWRPVKHPHDFATFPCCCCCVSGWIDASFAVCLFQSVRNAQDTNGANRFCVTQTSQIIP